ncbi:MAG: hypothetical protein GEU92_06225 [Alphaproteobacteria bacterium]|nr:hypothetical protein [Alphaproteobacteria bacterium]
MDTDEKTDGFVAARRRFLASCGRFAVITPPAVTFMLSSAQQNFAVASSGGHSGGRPRRRHANNGFGNGGHDGVPGRSDHQDRTR